MAHHPPHDAARTPPVPVEVQVAILAASAASISVDADTLLATVANDVLDGIAIEYDVSATHAIVLARLEWREAIDGVRLWDARLQLSLFCGRAFVQAVEFKPSTRHPSKNAIRFNARELQSAALDPFKPARVLAGIIAAARFFAVRLQGK